MKSRPTPFQARFCYLFFFLPLLLPACIPPPPHAHCDREAPVNDSLQAPELSRIYVNGREKRPDSVMISAREENLLVELRPMAADSYLFKLNIDDLPVCGIATLYPQISYTFLPGGKYQLEYWIQKEGASSVHRFLDVNVQESMFEKVWFIPALVAYVLFIIGAIIYLWMAYNVRQKLKMQNIRSRIAADLHDEVSSDLSGIAISITTLERRRNHSPEEFSTVIKDISQTLTDTQHNLSDTVWAIKPDKDTGGELFQRMHKFALQMLNPANVQLYFQNSIPADKTLKISMEQRHNVFKIFKEAIHNIYKHAGATVVHVAIASHPDGIKIDISDNGSGFDPEAERDGSGINNYFWRAKENLIDLHLETAPGAGTHISMVIPQF
jgi:signal transduction histidine kinase